MQSEKTAATSNGVPNKRPFAKNRIFNLRHELLILLGILAVTAAVYSPVTGYDFVDLDDDAYVFQNSQVSRGLTLEGVSWAFRTFEMANWHPLTWLSYMVDVELFGMNSGCFHLMNVFFHLANTLLLFILLRYTTSRLWQSALVAVLFALHPLHVESVAWVSERKDVLSTFFWMLCTLFYIRYARNPRATGYFGVVVLFILGLAAKPMLVTLPIALLLIDFWPLARSRVSNSAPGQGAEQVSPGFLLLEKIPLLAISTVFSLVTIVAQKRYAAVQSFELLPLTTRIANALVSYVGYLGKMVWPSSLTVLYPYPDHIPAATVVMALVFILTVSTIAFILREHCPYFLFGWLWYLVTLLPVIGIIQAGSQAMADRYTYVPLIGIFVIIAWGLPDLFLKWNFDRKVFPLITLVFLVVLSFITRRQLNYWQGSVSLFSHTISVTRDNSLAQNGLASGYEKQGKIQSAVVHYREALRISPEFSAARYNLGNVYLKLGKTEKAIEQYRRALESAPKDPEILNNLGKALIEGGRISEALGLYRRALKLTPEDVQLRSNMGAALVLNGQPAEAEKVFKEIIRLEPGFVNAYNNLGYVYEVQGRIIQAGRCYDRALRVDPEHAGALSGRRRVGAQLKLKEESLINEVTRQTDNAGIYFQLGRIKKARGDWKSALDLFRKAISVDPTHVPALIASSLIQAKQGRYDAARELLTRAIDIQPGNYMAHYYIAATYSRQNRVAESLRWLKMAVENGFNRWDLLRSDPNMDNIRTSPGYDIIAGIK